MDYMSALQVCADFTEGLSTGNAEYERGQLELLADLFPRPYVACGDRADEIAEDIRNLWRSQMR